MKIEEITMGSMTIESEPRRVTIWSYCPYGGHDLRTEEIDKEMALTIVKALVKAYDL